jgi:hypothetical protein
MVWVKMNLQVTLTYEFCVQTMLKLKFTLHVTQVFFIIVDNKNTQKGRERERMIIDCNLKIS